MLEDLRMIFLSFRDGDTPHGRVSDALAHYYGGKQNVYYFYEHHEFGNDFYQMIADAIAGSAVVVALIGRNWLSPEIFDPNDVVRFELSLALRERKQMLPIRFEIDSLPAVEALPDDLRALARRDAPPLSHERWARPCRRNPCTRPDARIQTSATR
jgi:hypothetical protein